ncbi:hypothetical protein T4E_162 [Trichinella pseudospiralis]|uniref:Uncharacterized protein n=1 Tax=Trichinella pseudospiralis TaxID=6337 RepID=A0A0V0XSR2_TRIPS|nr:hypothetical protein T4E_162 [Trichinella pseudospiralis]
MPVHGIKHKITLQTSEHGNFHFQHLFGGFAGFDFDRNLVVVVLTIQCFVYFPKTTTANFAHNFPMIANRLTRQKHVAFAGRRRHSRCRRSSTETHG